MRSSFAAATAAACVVVLASIAHGATTPPPAGARVIDFTDALAPVGFGGGKAVRSEYAALGVEFTASGLDGGAILDDDTILLVTGYSPPSFLAFSGAGFFSGGGAATFPQTLHFRHPVRYVQFNAASAFGNTLTIEAFDADDASLGTEELVATPNMQTVSIEARHIAKLVISGGPNGTVLDDLAFVLDSTVIDFDDVAAPTAFANATALRDRYTPEGVTFAHLGSASDGGAVLDEDANFTVTGYSPPNYLAFSSGATLSTGGSPTLPQYMLFSPPVKWMSINVANFGGGTVTIEAFDFNGQPVDSDQAVAAIAMQTLTVEGGGIATVSIASTGTALVADDLEFEIEGTLIDFDDLLQAPTGFSSTTALRDRYKALGIQFRGEGAKNGPAILDDGSNFGVSGYSAPNFLAFADSGMLKEDGVPSLPSILLFNPPIKRIDLRVGDVLQSRFDVAAFDAAGNSTGTTSIEATGKLSSIQFPAEGTTRIEITSTGVSGVIDDVAFDQVDPCEHDVCRAGDPLNRYCHLCATLVCAEDSDCCNDEWTTDCAKTKMTQFCEYTCLPICGDANDDRKTTSVDALIALRTAVGNTTCELPRCDYNGDAEVKSSDALAILRESVGIPTTPNCPDSITTK